MNKNELVRAVAESADLPLKDADAAEAVHEAVRHEAPERHHRGDGAEAPLDAPPDGVQRIAVEHAHPVADRPLAAHDDESRDAY